MRAKGRDRDVGRGWCWETVTDTQGWSQTGERQKSWLQTPRDDAADRKSETSSSPLVLVLPTFPFTHASSLSQTLSLSSLYPTLCSSDSPDSAGAHGGVPMAVHLVPQAWCPELSGAYVQDPTAGLTMPQVQHLNSGELSRAPWLNCQCPSS